MVGAIFVFAILEFLIPRFIKKYKYLITFLYGIFFVVALYLRYFNSLSDYNSKYKELLFIVFISSLSLILLLYLYESWRLLKEIKAKSHIAELALLKSKVTPHFLFNTLNNLYSLAIVKSDETPKVILKLSDLLRYSIYEGEKKLINLQDEINYIKNYFELNKIRYQKTVTISFDLDIDKTYMVPPLLFIILIENAFKHGVESLTNDAYINVLLLATNDVIEFQIKNNYDSTKEEIVKINGGLGLKNLKQRLDLLFPERYNLNIIDKDETYSVILIIWL